MTNVHRTVLFVTSVITLALIVFPVFAQVVGINTNPAPCGFPGMGCSGSETFIGNMLPFVGNLLILIIYLMETLAVIFLVVAGFQYITSQGDAEKSQKAKNQAIYAILGLILAISAGLIVNLVILAPGTPPGLTIIAIENLISPYFDVFLGLIGLIATIFIVIGGLKYINSQGDEQLISTAKKQIIYSIIGLLIAGLAGPIVWAVQNQDANDIRLSIRGVINAFLGLISMIATVYVILGGVSYIMAQGDQDKAARAKMQVFYAILGIVIIIVSAVIVNLVIGSY